MENRKAYQIFYFVISLASLAALCAFIFSLSGETAEVSSETSEGVIAFIEKLLGYRFSQEVIRTAAHFCEYALLGFLFINLFYSYCEKLRFVISAALSWAYAWSDEIHQLFVDGRAFQISDLAVDLGGILSGCAAFTVFVLIIKQIIKQKKRKSAE